MRIAAVVAVLAVTMFAGAASATVVYQDSFSRVGNLQSTAPDVVNTGGNLWQLQQSGQVYTTNGSTAKNTGAFGSIYLPVNGASGVTLDGTDDFTFSAVMTQGGSPSIGISLNKGTYSGGSMFANGDPAAIAAILATIEFNSGGNIFPIYQDTYLGSAWVGLVGVPTYFEMAYSAAADTLAYKYNATTIVTKTGVTAADIASLNYIALDNHAYGGGTSTFDDFKLDVVPEPATLALLGLGGLGLLLRRKRS